MAVIWITGGKGFIGRALAEYVAKQGYDIFGIGHGFWSTEEAAKSSYSTWINAEIDFSNLNHLASISGVPKVIFHLAGGSTVGASLQNPYEDFQRTVDTTARLLDWVKQVSPETRVVAASSAAVYGAGISGTISEQAKGTPYSPYGFHKAMLESLFKSYKDTFNLDVTVVRLFSVYGAGLQKQLLWDLCNKILKAETAEITLNGTGKELRDWLHVSDAVALLWLVGERNHSADIVINGGTGIATSISEVANKALEQWGGQCIVRFNGVARTGDPISLVADTQKATELGFKPLINIDVGIKDMVQWFKARVI